MAFIQQDKEATKDNEYWHGGAEVGRQCWGSHYEKACSYLKN